MGVSPSSSDREMETQQRKQSLLDHRSRFSSTGTGRLQVSWSGLAVPQNPLSGLGRVSGHF